MSARDIVGVPDPKLVYVLIADREKFDKIGLAATDHGEQKAGHVLSKSVDRDDIMVVFQHWLRPQPAGAVDLNKGES